MRRHPLAASILASLSGVALALELARGGRPCTAAFFFVLALAWRAGFEIESSDGALFCAAAAVYLSTFRWRGGDDGPASLIPFGLIRHHTLTLDPFVAEWFGSGKADQNLVLARGHYLSIFPVAAGLMALPFYALTAFSGVPLADPIVHQLAKLSAAAITAASVVAFRRALAGRCSPRWALTLTGVYALGTWAFSVSSQGLWQHGPACLGLALGLMGLNERGVRADALAGFGFSLAVAARPDSVFVAAAAGLMLLAHDRKRVAGFALGALAPALLLGGYWLAYTGRLLPPEHEYQAKIFAGFLQWPAFAALAASPTRGLLFYCPAALFGLWAAARGGARERWLALGSLGPWLLLSCYKGWTGGNTFGPRYFASTALVLLWLCAGLEQPLRRRARAGGAWRAAAAWSILTHACGAYLTWPGSQEYAVQQAQAWRWSLHPIAQLAAAEGPLRELPAPLRLGALLAALVAAAFGARALGPGQTARGVADSEPVIRKGTL
jgi:hypothetical protein